MRKIAILGGSGFVGRHLAAHLVEQGWWVRILSRQREQNRQMLVLPTAEVVTVDVYNHDALSQAISDCEVVVNLVGILNETANDGTGFRKAHITLTENVIDACRTAGVKRLLHMSALNADAEKGRSHYLRTKGEAQNLVLAATDLNSTVFRPSVIFGHDDSFFNRFAGLLRLIPFFLPLGSPHARFAPVWVNDVVQAMINSIYTSESIGQAYDLCGPKIYTLRELVEMTKQFIGVKRIIVGLDEGSSKLQARVFNTLPGKLISIDNYNSLQQDSVCPDNHLALLGIEPTSVEAVMPRHFSHHATPRTLYSQFRCRAGR